METLRQRVIRHEGIRLKPYTDSVGKLTIGIGRNLTDKGISQAEAYELFENDIADAKRDLTTSLPWTTDLPPPARDVLVEMVFQMGVYGVLQFKGMLKALQARNYAGAAGAMLDSRWATQTPARATELAALVRSLTPK